LNTNTIPIYAYKGGGRHGLLRIIITNDEYFSLVMDVFTALDNSGATPETPNNATAAQITKANRAHKEATRVYHTYNNVDHTFKKLIIDAFEDHFLYMLPMK
jgi:hypothetical protein